MTAVKIENGLVNSYRNKISEWTVIFRYGNFFIPQNEKLTYLKTGPFGNPIFMGKKKAFNEMVDFEKYRRVKVEGLHTIPKYLEVNKSILVSNFLIGVANKPVDHYEKEVKSCMGVLLWANTNRV